jgi:transcriptional regulator with XRE-family HTH domain
MFNPTVLNLSRIRLDRGWSIKQLAKRAGLTFTQVYLAERGRTEYRILKKIANALNWNPWADAQNEVVSIYWGDQWLN